MGHVFLVRIDVNDLDWGRVLCKRIWLVVFCQSVILFKESVQSMKEGPGYFTLWVHLLVLVAIFLVLEWYLGPVSELETARASFFACIISRSI